MADEQTLTQSADDERRARQRSLEKSRPPVQIPGYQTERFLGAGAYGEVWVARDRNTSRRVAIKFYTHRGGLDWSLLSREVEKLAFMFADRYVVQLIDVGWDADPPYYVMEYLERGSLAERLKAGPIAVDEALHLFHDIAIGLVHAHGKGVLHCDLKPANVLLDQDMHPRLADFGQSRMSNEQRPALGTMFYMAPEQADLHAVPDARWDVYALGAVLYCMLTGQPPYRSDAAAAEISQGTDIEDQLQRYVHLLHAAPPPSAHRATHGVSRDLVEIIDRCLAINPSNRFANPQAVLDALRLRTARRARRPLLVTGALVPALLLAIMSYAVWSGSKTSVKESEETLTTRALESNRFAARFVAETVAGEIDRRWYTLEQEASDSELRRQVAAATGQKLGTAPRKQLQLAIEALHQAYPELSAASWFVLDAHGNQLARSPFEQKFIDHNFAHRDYFNGLGRELSPEAAATAKPLSHPHRSHVFVSEITEGYSLAFSVPILSPREDTAPELVVGVIGITVSVGQFAMLRTGDMQNQNLVAALVDTEAGEHPGDKAGLIIEHPGLAAATKGGASHARRVYLDSEEVARLVELRRLDRAAETQGQVSPQLEELASQSYYVDPVDPQVDRWLAAFEPVFVRDRPPEVADTGWVVVVQEKFSDAVRPARHLGSSLLEQGLWALGTVLGVVSGLWAFVIMVLNDTPRWQLAKRIRKWAGLTAPVTSGSDSPGSGSQRSGFSGP